MGRHPRLAAGAVQAPASNAAPVQAPASDGVPAQLARLLHYLRTHGPASCAELGAACDVPSVTRRVCDLIAAGWPINRTRGSTCSRTGAKRRATFYELTGPHPQGDLFSNDTP